MSLPRAPFPMFSQHDWLSAQKPGEPANIQVKSKLESIAESCQAMESYKYASMFFESTLVSFEGSNNRRHRAYSRSLERLLNWSFLVAGKSVFDWTEHDIQCYLAFVISPDVSWVSSSPSTRFITDRGKPFNQWDINPNWKPFARGTFVETASQLTRHGVQIDRKILLEFLSYIVSKVSAPFSIGAAVAIEKKLLSPEKTSSPSLSSRLENDVAIFPYELDWIFNRTMGLIKLNWRYSLILFVMAVARYTRIPIAAFFKVVVAPTVLLCRFLTGLLYPIRVQQHRSYRLPVACFSRPSFRSFLACPFIQLVPQHQDLMILPAMAL